MPDVTSPQLESILRDLQSVIARLLEAGISTLPLAPARAVLQKLESRAGHLSVAISASPFTAHVYFVADVPAGQQASEPVLLFGFDSPERIEFYEPAAAKN